MNAQPYEAKLKAELVARRGCWKAVAFKTGVSYSWISKFVNGHIPNPGMRTLARLDEGLRDHFQETPHA